MRFEISIAKHADRTWNSIATRLRINTVQVLKKSVPDHINRGHFAPTTHAEDQFAPTARRAGDQFAPTTRRAGDQFTPTAFNYCV